MGVDLVPVVDYEICRTNVQLGDSGLEGVWSTPIVPPELSEEERLEFEKRLTEGLSEPDDGDSEKVIVGWHRGSHPFVCVVMLSNSEHMTDGETEMQKGDGSTMKVRAPQMVLSILSA